MLQSGGVINVYVSNAVTTLHKKGQLQISIMIRGLGASRRAKALWRVMQGSRDRVEQSLGHTILCLFAQFLRYLGKKPVPAQFVYLLHVRSHGAPVSQWRSTAFHREIQ